jgi:hypothetical protein
MRTFTLICAFLAILGGTLSANLWQHLRSERTLVAGLNSRLVAAQRRLSGSLPGTSPSSSSSIEVLQAKPDAPRAQDVNNELVTTREEPPDAANRKARLARMRAGLPVLYPGLNQAMGLSPEQTDRLLGLLAEYNLETTTTRVFGGNGQIDAQARNEMLRVRTEADRKLDESLRVLLGDSGFEKWREYQGSIPGRQESVHLKNSMAALGVTLSDAQMRPLTAAVTAEQSRAVGEFSAQFHGGPAAPDLAQQQQTRYRLKAESNSRIVKAMEPYMSSRDLEALRAELERQRARSRENIAEAPQ